MNEAPARTGQGLRRRRANAWRPVLGGRASTSFTRSRTRDAVQGYVALDALVVDRDPEVSVGVAAGGVGAPLRGPAAVCPRALGEEPEGGRAGRLRLPDPYALLGVAVDVLDRDRVRRRRLRRGGEGEAGDGGHGGGGAGEKFAHHSYPPCGRCAWRVKPSGDQTTYLGTCMPQNYRHVH